MGKKTIPVNKNIVLLTEVKETYAAELIIANKELAFQNTEKGKRAAELVIANTELAFQNQEKENRAAELVIANIELALQVIEKEKRANELVVANKELESFAFISSHDLQEPLRKIQVFSGRILDEEYDNLSEKGKYYFERIKVSALRMQTLINDLLEYSQIGSVQSIFENTNLDKIVKEVIESLKEELQEKEATIEVQKLCEADIIPFQFRQLLQNLISNSLKFCALGVKPHITIKSDFIKYEFSTTKKFMLNLDYYHISISDNGIGFDPKFKHKIFEIFQRLHEKNDYEGTGIGLTIVKKIVENHHGIITASGRINKGAKFDIYIPANQN